MQTAPGKNTALLTVSLILSACGGGGGTAPTPAPTPIPTTAFTKWSDVLAGSTVKINGLGQEVSGTTASGTFTTINLPSSVSGGYSATLTFDSALELTRLILTTPSTLVNFDKTAGATFTDLTLGTGPTPQFVGAISSTSVAVMANPIDLVGWDYQSFGVWETGLGTTSRTFGAMSVGVPTIGTAIPVSGTATFTGYATGSYVNAAGTGTTALADLTVGANFGTRSLTFNTTNTQTSSNWDTPTPTFTPNGGLNLSGTLDYAAGTNSFTGSVSSVGGMTGNSTGQFYGPNAEELGGVFYLKGSGVETYAGAYGAKQ